MTVPVVGQVLWIALMGVQGIVAGSDDSEESSDTSASDSADTITSGGIVRRLCGAVLAERSVPHD